MEDTTDMVIDLHSHILPEMDDGSDSLETSLKMLKEFRNQRVSVVCATSHYYRDVEPVGRFVERRERAVEALRSGIEKSEKFEKQGHSGVSGNSGKPDNSGRLNNSGKYPRILPGAEVAYFSAISDCRELEDLCIRGTNTLLLEMPFREWTGLETSEVLSLVLDRGLRVILAHPERYEFSSGNKKALRKLMELPVGIVVNADTLLSLRSRRQGLKLLTDAAWPLLGSDAHNLGSRRPRLTEGRNYIAKHLGKEFLGQMDETAGWLLGMQGEKA